MAGMVSPRSRDRAVTGYRNGEGVVDPFTRATSYFSQDRGGFVDKGTMAGLESGQLRADPANNRIVPGGDGGGVYMGSDGLNYERPPAPRAPSGGGGGGSSAFLGKLDQLWNTPAPEYDAPQQGEEMGVNPADDAYFAASKTRLGNTLQGGMNMMNNQLARRGISGDSRLAVGALGNLTTAAMSDAADTEREMTMDRQDRNRDIRDRNVDRTTGALRDNQQAKLSSTSRLSQLLSMYGMQLY